MEEEDVFGIRSQEVGNSRSLDYEQTAFVKRSIAGFIHRESLLSNMQGNISQDKEFYTERLA